MAAAAGANPSFQPPPIQFPQFSAVGAPPVTSFPAGAAATAVARPILNHVGLELAEADEQDKKTHHSAPGAIDKLEAEFDEESPLLDHKIDNITGKVDDGLDDLDKKYGSPDDLKDANTHEPQSFWTKVKGWFKSNYDAIIAVALIVAVVTLIALLLLAPPAAMLGAGLAWKMCAIFGGFAAVGAATSYVLFFRGGPEVSRASMEKASYLHNPENLKRYHKKINNRIKYYEADPKLPQKDPLEWSKWKLRHDVYLNMRACQLTKLKKDEKRLSDNLALDEDFKASHKNRVLGRAQADIEACRKQLDEEEVRLFKEMGMVPKKKDTIIAEGLNPALAGGHRLQNKGIKEAEELAPKKKTTGKTAAAKGKKAAAPKVTTVKAKNAVAPVGANPVKSVKVNPKQT